jgi:hypothetical protein
VREREKFYVTAITEEEKIIFNMLLCQGVRQTIIKLMAFICCVCKDVAELLYNPNSVLWCVVCL